MKDSGKVVVALLAGMAAGAVLGLLFAPEKGSDTRDKLNESLSDLGEAIKERAEQQIDQLNDLKEKVLAAVKAKASKVEEIVDDEIIEHA
ncbi:MULTISPECIES: YtxH domain-containing protein [Sphingobacterium]|uniref:Gas vesicle protein n=1 Tax=Sphingobacterium thermophilum TaxID=768534 RepID=A0ABP8R787_9SPHI|nr:YtxH domain-containing protein [Sphingobacterium sp. T2]